MRIMDRKTLVTLVLSSLSVAYVYIAAFSTLPTMNFDQQMRWLKAKLSNQSRVDSPIAPEEDSCFWLLWAGDSNVRGIIAELHRQMLSLRNSTVQQIIYSIEDSRHVDKRWSDYDMIVYFHKKRCIRISFRFLHGTVEEVLNINNSWSDIRNCNIDCVNITNEESCYSPFRKSICHDKTIIQQKQEFKYKSHPDFIVFHHGLWGSYLNSKFRTDPLFCGKRFLMIANFLSSLKEIFISVFWISNPWIYYHRAIQNEDLRYETACMIEHARNRSIEFFNLFSYTEENPKQRVIEHDFHISFHTTSFLVNLIWKRFENVTKINN